MGLFKTLFGDAAEELKKSYEDAKKDVLEEVGFKSSTSSKSSTPRHNNRDNVGKQGTGSKRRATAMSTNQDFVKKLWWVKDLELLYNGDKYALKYTGEKKKTTDYVYDDVALLNEYQARIAQKQADGSMLYGVACTCGWKFLLTDCEYTKVTFLDGIGAVLAIDEDGDEYAIDRWGKPYALEVYREKVEEDMNDNE